VQREKAKNGDITPATKFRTTSLADFGPGGIE
jgi:hypothetical protein